MSLTPADRSRILNAVKEFQKTGKGDIGAPSFRFGYAPIPINPEARRLKLRSDAAGFVWIKAFGGRLSFVGVCVTSWDQARGAVMSEPGSGRSFVLARAGAASVGAPR